MFTIELPSPPSLNTSFPTESKFSKKRNKWVTIRHLSKRGIAFRKAVADCMMISGLPRHLTGRLRVCCLYNPPDARVRDIANYEKATIDALTKAGAWLDDEQIDDFRIVRGPILKHGKITVYYEETTGPIIQGDLMLSEPPPF